MKKPFMLFVFFLCFLFFVSCSNEAETQETEATTAVKTVTDTQNKSYSVIVDADGFLMLGDEDKLAITSSDEKEKLKTDESGEFITQAVSFPTVVTLGNEIHTKFFRMQIPENWENVSKDLLKIRFSKEGLSAEMTVNERHTMSVDECVNQLKDLAVGIGDAKVENVSFTFADAKKLTFEKQMLIYVFNAENRTYFVKVTADEKLFEEIDFEEIVNTIKFRKGE